MGSTKQGLGAKSQMLRQLEMLRQKRVDERASARKNAGEGEPEDETLSPPALLESCERAIRDQSMPPRARAEFLVYSAQEFGLDVVQIAERLITRLDQAGDPEEDDRPRAVLQPEIYYRTVELFGGPAHVLLTPHGVRILPVDEDANLPELSPGDAVLVDPQRSRVVGLDGVVPPTGEVATLESIVDAAGEVATVRRRDETIAALIPSRLREDPRLAPGVSVILDAARSVVLAVIEQTSEPSELLAPVESLGGKISDLGAPPAVIDEILASLRDEIDHPEWSSRLGRRARRSFLFHGPTGTGKSTAIRAIAGEHTRWIEERTGAARSRVVFCDATRFHSPWFGDGERRVRAFFDQIHRLAGEKHRLTDGREVRLPVIVVLEELDGLVRRRSEAAPGALHDRILALILQQVDGAERDPDRPIVFIATTNAIDLLDSAAKRRFGERTVAFGHLAARPALSILEKLVPADLPIAAPEGTDPARAHRSLLHRTIHHLYLADELTIAVVTLRDGSRVRIERGDVISAAVLESAVARAKDRCLARSRAAGELVSIETDDVIEALDDQLTQLAASLSPENLPEQVPALFVDGPRMIDSVTPFWTARTGHGMLV